MYDGELFFDEKEAQQIAVKDRNISCVSQDFVLYPHMTVYDNVAYPLKLLKLPREEIDYRVRELCEEVEISYLLTRRPKYLSIGQQQRVAIARALAKKPEIILLDEPLSNLDKKTSEDIRRLIKELVKKTKSTCIYVSHNINDALYLADSIFVMDKGKVVGEFAPKQFLDSKEPIIESLKMDLHHEKES